jgi:hypothetical protein
MAGAVFDEVRHTSHRPVVLHDLADDARGIEPGKAREIDGSFRLPGPLQHAAGARTEREDVSRLDKLVRPLAGVDRDLDRTRSVLR